MSAMSVSEERKLMGVYEDVQACSFKSATGALDKILKKSPKSQSALALRMVLLDRSGAGDSTVLKAFEQFRSAGPEPSGRAVWWAIMALRSVRRHDLILELYQGMWTARHNSEELGEQVFLAAAASWNRPVLVSSSRKMFNMQKTAVWARIAAWAEWAANADQPLSSDSSRPFAPPTADASKFKTALVLLSTTKRSVPSSEALWLHAQIYLSAGQEDQALEIVRAEWEGSLARSWWRIQVVEEVAMRRADKGKGKEADAANGNEQAGPDGTALWTPEVEWAKTYLSTDSDAQRNYLYYRHLITAVLAISTADQVQTAKQVFSDLDDRIGQKERAPLLAMLELDLKAQQAGLSESSTDELKKRVETYWARFGARGMLVADFTGLLSHADAEVSEMILGVISDERNALAEKTDRDQEAYLRLSNAEILLAKHRATSTAATMKEVKRVWTLYLEGLTFVANLPKTDIQPADELGFLAVAHLLAINDPREEALLQLQAISMLRFMLSKSPSQKRAHFLLVRLYRLLGAPSLVAESLMKLDPAEVQLDNIIHIVTDRGVDAALGQTTTVLNTFRDKAELMYSRTASDLPDFVKQSLQHETYSKVAGIQSVARRIDTSLVRAAFDITTVRLDILATGAIPDTSIAELKRIVKAPSNFADNRNWELLPDVLPDAKMKEKTALGSCEVSGAWVRSWSGVLLAFGRFCSGEKVDLAPVQEESLMPVELAMLRAASDLLRNASEASSQTEQEGTAALESVFTGLIDAVKAAHSTRWESLYGLTLLAELSRMVDAVLKRLQDSAKPKKGKKTAQGVLDAVAALKAAKEAYTATLPDVLSLLQEMEKQDESLVDAVVAGSVVDEAFAREIVEEVSGARSLAISNARQMLEGVADKK